MNPVDASELPEVKDWIEGFGAKLNTRDFLLGCVSVGKAAAMIELLWPKFIERSGCVVLEWAYGESQLIAWLEDLDHDVSAVEALFNHIHLWDIFKPQGEAEEQFLVHLLERMQRCWHESACGQFPERDFDVSVSNDDSDYGPTISMRSI